MILLDIAGAKGKEIARAIGLTEARVSLIRNSPLYQRQLEIERAKLEQKVLEKQSTKVVEGDPVTQRLKELALDAVNTYEELLRNSDSDFVRKSSADAILDRAGYKAKTESTKVSIEVTERMAQRFEEVLKYEPKPHTLDLEPIREDNNESGNDARTFKVKIEEEMSS